MKQFFLRIGVGSSLLELRDKVNLVKTALTKIESLGTISNDILSTKLVTTICSSNKTFIDIGSHIGSIISEVQRCDDSIKIIGIEAIPEKVSKLKNSFPAVDFYQCALGNKTGEVSFYVNEKESGYSSLLAPKNNSEDHIKKITVPLKKLDELQNFQNVDVIKIDVEGAELGVILGAKETISRNNPIIMFESPPGDDQVKGEIWEVFTALEYGIHLPNRLAHNDMPLSKEGFSDSHIYPRYTTNYFAVPSDRRTEFRDRARKLLKIKL